MKALIFAAGLGTRLKPFTDTMPKALLPLAGHTLLEYQIAKLKSAGITDIIINVHHFADKIMDYVHAHDNFGCNIMFSDERDQLLETGGGLRKAWHTLNTSTQQHNNISLLALNADILSTIRLEDVLAEYTRLQTAPSLQHPTSNSAAVQHPTALLVVKSRQTSRYLCFDDNRRLIGWTNLATGETRPAPSPLNVKPSTLNVKPSTLNVKPSTLNVKRSTLLAFSGMQILSPSVLPMLDAYAAEVGDKFSVIDFYLSALNDAAFYGFEPQGDLLDVGKIDQLSEAERFAEQLPFNMYDNINN